MLLLALAMPWTAKAFYFQDPAVKAICVANWDTNHDGDLSYTEAAAVTSLGTAFRGNTDITSFLELQYFTSLTSLTCDDGYGTFQACYNLDLVNLPDALTTIGRYAFYDCRALRRIEIPSAVTLIDESAFESCWTLYTVDYRGGCDYSSLNTINEGAFSRCDVLTSFSIPYGVTEISANTFSYSGLRQIEIPSQVTSIGNYAFYHCVFLRTLTLCNNLTSIGESAFEDCSTLTTLGIPNSVTSIGASAFQNCTGLTTVNLGSSLHSIEESTFQNCSGLTTLNLGSYLQIIGESAFKNCSGLIVVTIPNNVTTIESYAFENCSSLTSLDLGSHVTTIKEYAFEGCIGLSSLTIPSSVTTIKKNAFNNCTNLTYVTINSNALASATYSISEDLSGIHYDNFRSRFGNQVTSYTFGSNVTAIGDYACYNCTGMTSVNLGYVATIGNYAFRGCSGLTSLTIPNYVTSIGEYAFYNCSGMTSVIIGNSLTSISNSTFGHCSGMTSVTIPSSVTSIGGYAFSECSGLTRVNYTGTLGGWCNISFSTQSSNPLLYAHNLYINDELVTTANWSISGSVTIIKPYAFYGCTGLNSVTIPLSVTSIGNSAFGGCTALTSVTLRSNAVVSATYTSSNNFSTIFGNQVESYTLSGLPSYPIQAIGNYAFYGCSGMTSLDIPSSVTSIGQYAFRGCSGLNSITIPNSVTSINSYTFYGCSGLTSVTIGNSVTSIGQYAFRGCSGLNSITIPNSVTSIGNYAFRDCTGLTEMTVERTTPPNAAANTFSNVPNTIPIYVPCGTKEAYQATNWNYFTNIVDPCGIITFADANVKSLCVQYWDSNQDGELSYDEAAAVTTLKPQGVTNSVFYNKPNITSFNELQYFTGLTSLVPNAFNYCSSLASVTLPNSVTTIGQYAFNRCTSLVSVSLGNSVVTIDKNAFSYCSQLASVTLPNTVTTIGNFAFEDCTSLTAIELPNSLTSIGNRAFNNTSLTSIVIPASVTSLVDNPFRFPSQATITVDENNPVYSSPNNCNAIIKTGTNELVVGCKNSVIPSTVTSIAAYAFYGCNGLTSITIPDAVVSIGDYSFRECTGLTSITFSNTLSSIGTCAFWNCSGLSSITLPSTLASIGSSAFYNCTGLTSITVEASAPPTLDGTTVFNHVNTGIPVIVPCESLETYQNFNNGQPWGGFSNIQCDDCTAELPLSENFDSYPGVTSGTVNVLPDCWSRINTTTVSSQQGYPTITEYSYAQSAPNFLYFMSSYVVGSYEDTQDQYAILPSVDNVSNLVLSLSARIPAGGRNGTFMVGVMTDPTDASTFTPLATFAPTTTTYQQYTVAFNSYSGEGHYIAIKMPAASSDVYYRGLCIDDVTLDIVSSPNIVFADANVKAICVQNWDTNNDGELSYDEATAVESLGYAFNWNENITLFNELQYFTGLTQIDDEAFASCTQLTSVIIPSSVTAIGYEAFYNCSSFTSITIPNSVTDIYDEAFFYCSNLVTITIPSSVTYIEFNPFIFCPALENITVEAGNTVYDSRGNCNAIIETASNTLISGCKNTVVPNTVTTIGSYAFNGCTSLTSITIPSSVTSIGSYAFDRCTSLTSITIPSSVTTIGGAAFAYCSALANIVVEAGNTVYDSRDNCNAIIEMATNTLITGCQSTIIPSTVTSIGESAFYGHTGLTSIAIPNSVTTIDQYAFSHTGLTEVNLPNTVTAIGDGAFSYCSSVTSAILPSGLTSINNHTFSYCTSLQSITIPSSVTSIGNNAFYNCSGLTSITVEATTPPTLGTNAFRNVPTSIPVYVPCGTKAAYQAAAGWSAFTNFVDPCEAIVFADPAVKALCVANWDTNGDGELSYPEAAAVTSLGSVFYEESITTFNELQYFTGLEYIDDEAFANCTQLTSVIIPSSVTFIAYESFWNCSSLTSVTIPSSVTTIGDEAFYDCSSLTSVTIPGSVTTIGYEAFSDCSSLTSIIIPNGVTTIGYDAFHGCSSLTSVTIPSTVTTMIGNLFPNCPALASITVEAGNTVYDSRDNCNAIIETATNTLIAGCKNTVIPNTVTTIGGSAFYSCTGLTSITIPSGVSTIGHSAFNSCNGLTSITIPGTVTSIGSSAFSGCSGLTEMTVLATTPPTLGTNAFLNVPTSIPVNVPCGTKAAYQAAAGWSAFTNFVDPCDVIVFADPAVKALCVANWDSNGDGELSYPEAAEVTTLNPSGQYGNGVFTQTTISSFDELQYFTGLTTIDGDAFRGCQYLSSIMFPASITSIGAEAFSDCQSLSSIAFPSALQSIGNHAFSHSGLTSVTIPATVTNIGFAPYSGCNSLASIAVADGNTVYSAPDGCNVIIKTSTNNLVQGCKNSTIPDGVTIIGAYAFHDLTSLTSVTLPGSVTLIQEDAFSNAGLASITLLGATPPALELWAFDGVSTDIPVNVPCGSIEAYQAATGWSNFTNYQESDVFICFADPAVKALCVTNWDSNGDGQLSYDEAAEVTSLGGVFQGNAEITSFDELQYFTSVTVIQVSAFSGCSGLESVTLPDALTTIGSNAFRDCSSLESITLPNSLTTILDYAFNGCSSLTTIEIPNTVNSLGRYVFSQCTGLTSVTLPNSLTTIKTSLFEGCSSLNSVIIPDAVTAIDNAAFRSCSSLTSIEIPNAVTSIGSQAFNSCTNLQSITCLPTTPPTLVTHAFSSATYNSATLTVPCESVSAYQSASYWSNFTHIVGGCEQATALEAGWNWWAPTVEMSMEDFEAALVGISGDILINSQDEGFARRTGGTWDGTLTSIELGKMYKIKTTAGATLTMAGDRPATVTVTILPGYTWFGYTGTQASDIATALGSFTPATGDQIIGENGTATYNGSTWTSEVATLKPGHGYIYYSNATSTKTLTIE